MDYEKYPCGHAWPFVYCTITMKYSYKAMMMIKLYYNDQLIFMKIIKHFVKSWETMPKCKILNKHKDN